MYGQKTNRHHIFSQEAVSSIYKFAYRITGITQDAEDLTQETFLKACSALPRFDTRKKIRPWIFTIARNLIRNHLKSKRLRSTYSFNENQWIPDKSDSRSAESEMIFHQDMHGIARSISQLPIQYREAVVLRYVNELPFGEISEILGVSEGNAKMRTYRGLEKIRKMLKNDDGEK